MISVEKRLSPMQTDYKLRPCYGAAAPEKAAVGGSAPSLATIIPKGLKRNRPGNSQPTISPMISNNLSLIDFVQTRKRVSPPKRMTANLLVKKGIFEEVLCKRAGLNEKELAT